jgi:hypothetical protein
VVVQAVAVARVALHVARVVAVADNGFSGILF